MGAICCHDEEPEVARHDIADGVSFGADEMQTAFTNVGVSSVEPSKSLHAEVEQPPAAAVACDSAHSKVGNFNTSVEDIEKELGLADVPLVDFPMMLQQCGSLEFLEQILIHYHDQCQQLQNEMRKEMDLNNWYAFSRAAHSLKGCAANLFILRTKALAAACQATGEDFSAALKESSGEVPEGYRDRGSTLLAMLESLHSAVDAEVEESIQTLKATIDRSRQ
eukprot:NODE_4031_length_874_cov_33.232727_g3717_i0.p1 GENE.NODE_4031_length_874_cov_33.232727_g3717_i0~~NODE_4031_length_874_cov_33.232727_g3717_i0.p1  ORF type:complete len:261 (+),score=62.57 NODE_4031_length_874_cov_33.232727_g3717_i0:120-785(+)